MPPKTKPKSSTPANRPLAPQMAPAYKSKGAPRTIKRQTVVTRSRDPNTKLAQETRTTYENPYVAQTRKPGQASAARKRGIGGGTGGRRKIFDVDKPQGIGLLEAEFFLCLAILVLIMFTSKASLADKIVSTLKRGTLTCIAFFILALIAAIGPRSMMVAKAFGALILVALLLTAPVTGVNKDIDNLIKNDWVATNAPATSNTNQQNALNNTAATDLGAAIQGIISGLTGGATTGGTNAKAFAAGIIQGLKSVFGL